MLSIEQIELTRNGKTVLNTISFQVKEGEIIGIVGASGTGKSSLLKIIAGLLDADSGRVMMGTERIAGPSNRLIPGHPEIQLVNQDFALDMYHTTEENLKVQAAYLPNRECEELVDELLDLLDLRSVARQQARYLSGGEQQRLALGRALAKEPKIILLDEPFAHIDVHLKTSIAGYLLKMRELRGTTFILVSHDGTEVLSLTDRILFFEGGNIRRNDTPENYYFLPENLYQGLFFGAVNEVVINGEKIVFRPTEYILDGMKGEEIIDDKFSHYSF